MTKAALKREFPDFPGLWRLHQFLSEQEDAGSPRKVLLVEGYFDFGRDGTPILDALIAHARRIKGYSNGAESRFNEACWVTAEVMKNWKLGVEPHEG